MRQWWLLAKGLESMEQFGLPGTPISITVSGCLEVQRNTELILLKHPSPSLQPPPPALRPKGRRPWGVQSHGWEKDALSLRMLIVIERGHRCLRHYASMGKSEQMSFKRLLCAHCRKESIRCPLPCVWLGNCAQAPPTQVKLS